MLRAMKEKIVSRCEEKKFGRLVTARGDFSPDEADVQLRVDESTRDQKFDQFREKEGRRARRDHEFIGEPELDERAERELYELIGDKRDKVAKWAKRRLEQWRWNADRVRIVFDPETNLRFCAACQFPAKELNRCLKCGSTC